MNKIEITFNDTSMNIKASCTQYELTQAIFELLKNVNIDLLQNILRIQNQEHTIYKEKNNE